MIDEAESFVTAAKLLKERGAYKILVMVTHGLLSANAPELIDDSVIDEVTYLAGIDLLYYCNFYNLKIMASTPETLLSQLPVVYIVCGS